MNYFYKLFINNAYLLLCLAMLGWAGNTIAGRLSTGEISPNTIVFLRWLIVSIFLLLIQRKVIFKSISKLRNKVIWLLLMGGLGWTGFNTLFYIAAQKTSAINLGIIQGTMPAMILVGTVLFFGAQVNFIQIFGLIITFFGVVVVVSKGDLNTILLLTGNTGDLIMFCSCFFYAGFTLGLKYKPEIDGLTMMTFFSLSALLSSIPLLIFDIANNTFQFPNNYFSWSIIIYIAFAPSFLAQVFFIRGVELIGPSKAGLFINLIPIFSALLGVLILGEQLKFFHLISLIIVFIGIYLFMILGEKN